MYNLFSEQCILKCRTTRNPHAPERYTGGSSSGPAAIVASGLCSAALGTDGGGCANIICWLPSDYVPCLLIFLCLICNVKRQVQSVFRPPFVG
jgi:hypothetical protein